MPSVKLIALTQPLIKTEDDSRFLTPEELIVYCARVSNPNNQLNMETADKLLHYCIKHGHWSVFEQTDMTVEVKTSRAIAQQIIRHKFNVQEFSQRYSSVQAFESVELRQQASSNRQSSTQLIQDAFIREDIDELVRSSEKLYNEMIDKGVARECARMILPLCTQTTMYLKNNVRGWIHYIDLRTKEDTQKEHRLIAEDIKTLFVENFPMIAKAKGWV